MGFRYPRLTTALQAFGDSLVAGDAAPPPITLKEKREFMRQREREHLVTWAKFAAFVKDKAPGAMEDARCFHKQIVGVVGAEADSEALDHLPFAVFSLLQRAPWSLQLAERVRSLLGPVEAAKVQEMHAVVAALVALLGDEVTEQLLALERRQERRKMFGQDVEFHFNPRRRTVSSCSEEESSPPQRKPQSRIEDLVARSGAAAMNGGGGGGGGERFDEAWIRQVVAPFAPKLGVPADQLTQKAIAVLLSGSASEAIQNELFDLLGYDGFDVIERLLKHRPQIIEHCRAGVSRKQTMMPPATALAGDHREALERWVNGNGVLEALRRNPRALAERREQQVSQGPRQPPPRLPGATEARPRFPYVFDQLAEVAQTAAYISSAKLHLPKDHVRRNERLYEEVRFPPPTLGGTAQFEQQFPRVPIAKLDDVARLAFAGMTKLNLIQSIVFETAYKTNENLLVCAPTGAGKTNVALLTIVHELKQHIGPGGVVRKDDFKIVYIAPMKALAAEMTRNFSRRLEPLGITVKECTGDTQLSKADILRTQMLVVTPEKWDVMTRKSTGDVALVQIVKLLIIDEVHLLHEDRGAVIEALVARTLRQVEASQRMIRIVGLSATLPNYHDVATFLRVNPQSGLFFFDNRFRPVPLGQTFIGVKSTSFELVRDMNTICYERVLEQVRQGEQVMVFVHARQETRRTAYALREAAQANGTLPLFLPNGDDARFMNAKKLMQRSRNGQLKDLFDSGFAMHHAGMLRSDRNLVERLFSEGHIRCLCCTATLAWGVNLPAHAVIIKGTQIYDAEKSSFVDLGILDVLQIFGRAGRPQFDRVGFGTIITSHEKLSHYLQLMCRANPIESQFIAGLTDNLNAEIALGSVTNVDEAVRWLSYTYLYVRMRANPMAYGISYETKGQDPTLLKHRNDLIVNAGRKLDKARMVRFDERTGYFASTDLGRTASHFYIKYPTVETVNMMFKPQMMEAELFDLVASSQEFSQIKVREEEMDELGDKLNDLPVRVKRGPEHTEGKVNILMQAYILRLPIDSFSLVSDQMYIQQNAARIVRALFEVALRKGWPLMASRLLSLTKMVERQVWCDEEVSPMAQFASEIRPELRAKVERYSIDYLLEVDVRELGHMIRDQRASATVKRLAETLPRLALEASIQPITRTILRVSLQVRGDFLWSDRHHGNSAEPFWIWVEDPDNNHIYHYEYFLVTKKQVQRSESQSLIFTIPIFEPLPSQYIVRGISDRWLGCETALPLSFRHLILPQSHPPHTELLDLQPLPLTALRDAQLQALYPFSHFNPIQTQIFHALYHTDDNVLLGAPTGSGKTVAAELAIFRVFRMHPKKRCVYIAPLKALVRERMEDWKERIENRLGRRVVELTGDVTPDMRAVGQADLIVTTPEKWDGVSRSWQQRSFVRDVALIVIDEIHLLGDERGPVLEVIVSRTNFIASHTNWPVRVVGLSTALANARDLGSWLGIHSAQGMYNFRPSVRPVPLEVHIQGYAGRHYCPRMATMNKPVFQAIRTHSPAKPALVFVSSRRQTRLTALDLIAFLAAEDDPKQWLRTGEEEIDLLAQSVRDSNLRLTLGFGIGLHHAGLQERDRKVVEELFVNQKIQVLIATSTLAWGVNFPAHLVIVKGTEFFDGKTKRYVDYPITDVLQMMGRAGRPQFDDQGKAVVMVHDIKKHFYKRFLYEPFPVESNLLSVLSDHINAEIVAGTINNKQDAVDYITWTYFFRRLVMNPTYYELDSTDHTAVNQYLSKLVEKSLLELEASSCVVLDEDGYGLQPQALGRIASYYYLAHETARHFRSELRPTSSLLELLEILCRCHEFAMLPVRHNEDQVNAELAKSLPVDLGAMPMDSAHTKAHLLLQAHFSRQQLPMADYVTDTKSVLDQTIRILQGMIDSCADQGWLATSLRAVQLIQMVLQARWLDDSSLMQVPGIEDYYLRLFHDRNLQSLPELIDFVGTKPQRLASVLRDICSQEEVERIFQNLRGYPIMEVACSVRGHWDDSDCPRTSRPVPLCSPDAPPHQRQWLDVHADGDYVLEVRLQRRNAQPRQRALAPKFPKPKDEGWILLLGEVDVGELWAIKRVPVVRQSLTTVPLSFIAPPDPGRAIYTLFLMSDCYQGLDQQVEVCLNVLPPSSATEEVPVGEKEG